MWRRVAAEYDADLFVGEQDLHQLHHQICLLLGGELFTSPIGVCRRGSEVHELIVGGSYRWTHMCRTLS